MHPIASQSLLVRPATPLKGYIVPSILGHVGLLVLAVGYQYFATGPSIDLDQKPIRATLVRRGTPRDEKMLPRKEELPPPPEKSEGQAEPIPTPPPANTAVAVPVPGLKPADTKSQKQEGETQGTDRRKSLFSAFSKTGKKTKVEDLAGQLDGDPMGDSATAEGERYFGLLIMQIRRHYDVSETIPDQERLHLRAVAKLFISRTGEVMRVDITKPSGNGLFDAAVKAAAKKASPVSPPPEHLRDQLQRSGIPIEFKP
jgi:TonB family protein